MLVHNSARRQCSVIASKALPVAGSVSRFLGQSGVEEYHLMLHPTAYADIDTQLTWMESTYRETCSALGLDAETAVLRRCFCSDLPNQAVGGAAHPFARPGEENAACAVSLVCQPPLPPAKAALWAYHLRLPEGTPDKQQDGSRLPPGLADRSRMRSHRSRRQPAPTGVLNFDRVNKID